MAGPWASRPVGGMSRYVHKGEAVTVVAGWDRPCGHWFSYIYPEGANEPSYASIYDPALQSRDRPRHLFGGQSWEELVEKISGLVPQLMLDQLKLDGEVNAGNVTGSF